MKDFLEYKLRQLICLIFGHDWYIVDYVNGMENNNVWNIKECDRCRKAEFD